MGYLNLPVIVNKNGTQYIVQRNGRNVNATYPVDHEVNWKLWLEAENASRHKVTTSGGVQLTGNGTVSFSGSGSGLFTDTVSTSDWAIGTNFTLQFWVKTTYVAGNQFFASLFSSVANEWYFRYLPGTTQLSFYGKCSDGNGYIGVRSSTDCSITDGAWHHIALVKEGSTWRVFLDGVNKFLDNDGGTGTTLVAYANELDIARRGNGTDSFVGEMDQFEVRHDALYSVDFTPPTRTISITPSVGVTRLALDFSRSRWTANSDILSPSFSEMVHAYPIDEYSDGISGPVQRNDIIGTQHLLDPNSAKSATGVRGRSIDLESGFTNERLEATAVTTYNSKFALSIWVNPESFPTGAVGSEYKAIFSMPNAGETTYDILATIKDNTGGVRLVIFQSGGVSKILDVDTVLTLSTWSHLLFVADGSFLRLYHNGSEVGTAVSYDGTIRTTNQTQFKVGAYKDTDDERNFDGLIDEIYIWKNQTFITDDIASALWNGGDGAFYKMARIIDSAKPDSVSPVLPDVSGNENDAIQTNVNWNLIYDSINVSLESDGIADHLIIPDDSLDDQSFTLFAIAKFTLGYYLLTNQNGQGYGGWRFGRNTSNGKITFETKTNIGTALDTIESDISYTDNDSFYLVTVKKTQGGEIAMWINGTKQASVVTSSSDLVFSGMSGGDNIQPRIFQWGPDSVTPLYGQSPFKCIFYTNFTLSDKATRRVTLFLKTKYGIS